MHFSSFYSFYSFYFILPVFPPFLFCSFSRSYSLFDCQFFLSFPSFISTLQILSPHILYRIFSCLSLFFLPFFFLLFLRTVSPTLSQFPIRSPFLPTVPLHILSNAFLIPSLLLFLVSSHRLAHFLLLFLLSPIYFINPQQHNPYTLSPPPLQYTYLFPSYSRSPPVL